MDAKTLRERLVKIRVLVETQAEMAVSQIDAALAELEGVSDDGEPRCPECGEDNTEESTAMNQPRRWTCLACGVSFHPNRPEEVSVG